MNSESGFTLLEIVVSMIILGIMVAIAGLGIVTATKGYLFTRENAHMAQKAQLAMARMNRELTELMDVTSATQNSIVYERPGGQYSIAKVGGVIKIREGSASPPDEDNGDILIDNVDNFTLTCYQIASGTTPVVWTPADEIDRLYAIEISMTLSRSESDIGNVSFSTTVNPRNNKNYGGAPPTTNPPSKAGYGCFVATAAYGQPDHPMVLLLRQFRDRLLLTWKGGKSVVRAYYAIGPFIAEKIKDRAWACLVARLFLLPFTGIAFLMLHLPAAIPLILLVSWLIARMVFSLTGHLGRGVCPVLSDKKGSVLIALIVTMVVLSSIGGAMISLTSTSTFSRVGSNSAERAYFLAESGYRYAASRYLNAADETAKDSELVAMHTQQTFTLLNDNGQFQLRVYPYYFKTTGSASVTPAATLNTSVPGGFPPGLTLSSGRLKIGSKFHNYSSASQAGSTVTFTLSTPIIHPPIDMDVLSVATSSSSVQTVSKGGDINLDSNNYVSAFPARNGTIKVDGHIYAYKKADLTNNRLTGIYDPAEPNMSPFSMSANTNIILQKFAKLHSTGVFGQGSVQTKREIIFHVPLPTSSTGEKEEFHDTFEDKSHWKPSTLGSHAIQTIGGDKALKVTGMGDVKGAVDAKGSLITLDWKTTNVDLASAHRAAGHYLSYDAQVKIGFDPPPPWTYNSKPFPEYYMAGISFRQKYNGDSYGLSFVRGNSDYDRGDITDGIPDNLLPQNDWPMIVLWQQTDSDLLIPDRKWLAYKYLTGHVFFSDDMESGTSPNWTPEKPWAHTGTRCHSGSTCWFCSPSGVTTEAALEYNQTIDISGTTPPARLSFWHWYELTNCSGIVEISVDGGSWTSIGTSYAGNLSGVTRSVPVEIDISSYVSIGDKKLTLRFLMKPGAAPAIPGGEGWYIDDVRIYENFPINESTLLVRIKEAASYDFTMLSGTTVEDGDYVVGQTSHAKGKVFGTPIVTSGSWGAGNAQGVITLNNVTGDFLSTENLRVIGSATFLGATGYRSRDNYIMAYYGDINGYGTPNNTPLDNEKHGNPRGELHWPPDEVNDTVPDNDYFTLVQWDADIDTSVERLGTGLRENAIIRTDAITTTASGNFGQPEIGLHTFGYSSTNVYFDDFGLQAEVGTIMTTPPIQE
jgi:prepilin-type N-terminal cleavage/methylation domain-containing protein